MSDADERKFFRKVASLVGKESRLVEQTGNYYADVYFCLSGNRLNIHWYDQLDGHLKDGYRDTFVITVDENGRLNPVERIVDEDLADRET